jgi:hypothetical protein
VRVIRDQARAHGLTAGSLNERSVNLDEALRITVKIDGTA